MAEGTASEGEHPSDGEPSKRHCESQGVCETEEREKEIKEFVSGPLLYLRKTALSTRAARQSTGFSVGDLATFVPTQGT